MITDIRRHFKGAAYKSVLWITIFALAGIFSLPSLMRKTTGGGPWVARINGQEIGYQDFMREVNEQRDRLLRFRAQYGEYADLLLASMGIGGDPQSLAFNTLCKEELLNQVAHHVGLHINPAYVTEQLQDPYFVMQELTTLVPPQAFGQTGINMQMLANYLQRRGWSIDAFEHKVERIVTARTMLSLAAAAVYIPEYAYKYHYQTTFAKKRFSILTFSFDKFLKEARDTKISANEIKQFFTAQNAQSKRYWIPEKRSGLVWKFSPHSYGIQVQDKEVEAYYNDHKAKLFVESPAQVQVRRIAIGIAPDINPRVAQEKAQQVYMQVKKSPEQFSTLAHNFSEDSMTAKNGGLMPYFARGEQEEALERAAFLLKEDGDISEIIRTSKGYEILQRVHKKMIAYKPFSTVRNDIENTLLQRKFKEQFMQDMKEILAVGQAQTFEDFIAKKGIKPTCIDVLSQDNSSLAKTMFKTKLNDRAFYVDDTTGVIVKVTNIQPTYEPTLESVQTTVLKDLYEERAKKQLAHRLQEAKKEAVAMSLETIKERYGATVEHTGWLSSQDENQLKILQQRDLPLRDMLQLEKVGSIIIQGTDRNGYLVRLDAVEQFNEAQFQAKETEIKQVVQSEYQRQELDGYVASLHRSATIETGNSNFDIDENIQI